jgi:hypothetical protein
MNKTADQLLSLAVVRAVLDRSAAVGTRRLTGTWPAEQDA